MKIVIDARLYGLENAGLGRYTLNLINELEEIDTTNEYVILLRKKYFDSLVFPKNWKKVLADFSHYSFTEQIKIPGILSKEKPDLVHFLHMNVPLFYRGKFVVTVHDLLMQKHRGAAATTLPFYSYFSKLIAAKYIFRNAVTKSQKIIVPSNAVKDEIIGYYKLAPDKINVIYEGATKLPENGKDNQKVLEKYEIKAPYLIYSGNGYPHKNLKRAIQSVKLVNKNETKIYFYITSSRSTFSKKLERLIKEENAEDYVKFLGFIPDEELSILFKNSVGFLYPSLSEGFGLPGLEAMSSGTISLVSNIPVFKEIYKDAPLYFDPYSVDSMTKTITNALNLDIAERKKMITVGQKLISGFSWKKMAEATLQIYIKSLARVVN